MTSLIFVFYNLEAKEYVFMIQQLFIFFVAFSSLQGRDDSLQEDICFSMRSVRQDARMPETESAILQLILLHLPQVLHPFMHTMTCSKL